MEKDYDVRITLISQKSKCAAGHRVGDQFLVGRKTPDGLCIWAFNSLLPFITTLRFGGTFHWEKNSDQGTFCCPDSTVVNTFRLERVRKAASDDTSNQ